MVSKAFSPLWRDGRGRDAISDENEVQAAFGSMSLRDVIVFFVNCRMVCRQAKDGVVKCTARSGCGEINPDDTAQSDVCVSRSA